MQLNLANAHAVLKSRPVVLLLASSLNAAVTASLPEPSVQRDREIASWQRVFDEPEPSEDRLAERDCLAKRKTRAALALVQLGKTDLLWPLLRHSSDPSLRSYLIRDLSNSGVSPDVIVQRLQVEPDVSARRAMILSLGGFTADQLPPRRRKDLLTRLLMLYRSDPDVGIHSAIDWLLRHDRIGLEDRKLGWHQADLLYRIDKELAGDFSDSRNWYVTKLGDTMAVIRGPIEFIMGAPLYEPGRDKDDAEAQHRERIPRSYAISTKEVTIGQFQRFLEANPEIKKRAKAAGKRDPTREGPTLTRLHLDDDCPQVTITWFEAAQYCAWLSQQEGIPRTNWCYPSLDEIKEGMQLPGDYLSRTGYRLPTDAEWEYACRAGAKTSRSFGSCEELLREYAWYTGNTFNERPWPVGQLKPNDFGLFDMYGNVWEWIQDVYKQYKPDTVKEDSVDTVLIVSKEYERLRRGGSYTYAPDFLRSAHRNHYIPDERRDSVGFRIARTVLNNSSASANSDQ